ncbi:MAG: BON domain-containing protein [Archangium sp.]
MQSLHSFALLGAVVFSSSSFAAAPKARADGFITSNTKLSLWTLNGLRSRSVHVDTSAGVVTLYGEVPSAEHLARAEKTAAGIEGVRSVKNLLKVVPASETAARSDTDISDDAQMALRSDAALKDSRILIRSVERGVVLLTGTATSYGDQLHAITIVDRVAGVRRVTTEVKGPRDYRADERVTFVPAEGPNDEKILGARGGANDSRISMAVKLRLLTAAQIPSNGMNVDTEDSVVTLFGVVPSNEVRTAAAQIAAKVGGVTRVDNDLEVAVEEKALGFDADDEGIAHDVKLAFRDRKELKNVTTVVRNGTVQLSGKVPTGWARLDTLRLARAVSGVSGIDNQLTIE